MLYTAYYVRYTQGRRHDDDGARQRFLPLQGQEGATATTSTATTTTTTNNNNDNNDNNSNTNDSTSYDF